MSDETRPQRIAVTGLNWEKANRRDQMRQVAPPKGNRSRRLPKPTQKQLKFLKALASKTGTTFAKPKSRQDASSEIDRLLALPQKYRS